MVALGYIRILQKSRFSWIAEVRGKPFDFQGGGLCGFKYTILQAYLSKQKNSCTPRLLLKREIAHIQGVRKKM